MHVDSSRVFSYNGHFMSVKNKTIPKSIVKATYDSFKVRFTSCTFKYSYFAYHILTVTKIFVKMNE